ncbi:hypothetical protein K4F52_003539 [Lecanicillium sp. MT-2017a]|nr:hypothetical protein K4F52_003539 [Lecanicillium sp. MT-2017a]
MPLSHKHHHPKRDFFGDFFGGDFDPFNPFGKDSDSQNSGGGSGNSNSNGNGNGNGNGNSNNDNSNSNPDKKNEGRDQATVVKTIYKTMSQTFDGKPAGYATLAPDSGSGGGKSPAQETGAVGVPVQPIEKESSSDEESATPSEIRAPTDSTSLGSVLAKATGEASVSPTAEIQRQPSTPLSMPSTTSDSDAASANKDASSGTSAGAKAGIALGVLGGLFLIGMIVFLIFNRRKKQAQREKIDDEKMHGAPAPMAGADHLQAMPTSAPRISLRPVTQFLPNWNLNDKRTSKGAAMALGPTSAAQRGPETNAWDRPGTSQSNHPNNPFGNSAERVDADERGFNGPNGQAPRPEDPFTANGPAMAAGAAAGAAAAGGAAALTRKTSMRKNGDRAVDLTLPSTLGAVPPSPAGTEFSQSSVPAGSVSPPSHGAAAIAAAGGPATSTVHRVQLDFKPTLDDEMELKAGDLVRLLHEYDDGWALCIRLDRSQQGVVPRTCLSARPVKPRPPPGAQRPGPPVNPQNGLPRGPNQPQGRPMTPQGRPMMPQGYAGPGPRPQSPGPRYQGPPGAPGAPGGRPMSPGPNGPGPRSQSPGPRYQGPPGGRPMSPGPNGPGPRPQSPGPRYQGPPGGRPMSPGPNGPGPRPQSPGPRYQGPPNGRPQSPNGMDPRRMSPPGPSAMNPQSPRQGPPANKAVERKPVPGQAY